MDMKIMIKERGGFGKEKLHRKFYGREGIEPYEVFPYFKDIDHKKYTVKVVYDDKGGEWDNVEAWDYTTEWCSCCGEEVDIKPFGISFCSNCGEQILPCSMCDECGDCPY